MNTNTTERAGREPDADWRTLYRVGGVAILVAVAFFRRNYGVELVAFKGFGIWQGVPAEIPRSAVGWFVLLRDHWFVGLNLLGLRDLVNYCLVGLFFLALSAALWRVNKSATAIALAAGMVGVAVFLSTNQAFSMLTLSRRHVAATSEVQRAAIEAAGEAVLAVDNPGLPNQGLGYVVSLGAVSGAGLIFSLLMLRSEAFGRVNAWSGVLANALMLGFVVMLVAPLPVGAALYAIPPSISALFRMVWYVSSAIRLLRLSRSSGGGG